jgi:hypothetical protein
VADAQLLKRQRMQNLVLRSIDNFVRRTSVREMYKALKIHYIYDSITKLRRKQAEVIRNRLNPNVLATGKKRPCIGSMIGFNLAMVRPTTVQVNNCRFGMVGYVKA